MDISTISFLQIGAVFFGVLILMILVRMFRMPKDFQKKQQMRAELRKKIYTQTYQLQQEPEELDNQVS